MYYVDVWVCSCSVLLKRPDDGHFTVENDLVKKWRNLQFLNYEYDLNFTSSIYTRDEVEILSSSSSRDVDKHIEM